MTPPEAEEQVVSRVPVHWKRSSVSGGMPLFALRPLLYGCPHPGRYKSVIWVAPTAVMYGEEAGHAGHAWEHARVTLSRM